MMNSSYRPPGMCSPGYVQAWQRQLNYNYTMPTQNYFGPLSDMIEDSLNMDNTPGYLEPMETVAAQNKRRKFSSGTDINIFNNLSLDDKLSHMLEKLNNLKLSQRAIESITHRVTQASSKVEHMSMRMNNHEHFFRLLAYKSIDIDARSRRKNLIFHGLAESCKEVLRNFFMG